MMTHPSMCVPHQTYVLYIIHRTSYTVHHNIIYCVYVLCAVCNIWYQCVCFERSLALEPEREIIIIISLRGAARAPSRLSGHHFIAFIPPSPGLSHCFLRVNPVSPVPALFPPPNFPCFPADHASKQPNVHLFVREKGRLRILPRSPQPSLQWPFRLST